MSSKNAEARRRTFFPRSITARLTFFYTLATFGILFLAVLFLYRSLKSNLDIEDEQFLAEKHHVLSSLLRKHPDNISFWKEEVQWESSDPDSARYFARVLDNRGRVWIETPGMNEWLPAPIFSPPPETGDPGIPQRRLIGGRTFLTLSAAATTGLPHRQRRVFQMALDISNEVHFLAGYRRRLTLVLLLGMGLAAAAGASVARRGLAPLQRIARAMERITASRLDERINPERWPKELAAIAQAFNRMLDRLEDSFTRLSQFSADLAHEMRTPLNNLMGETEVALSKTRSAEDYRTVLESAMEEYGRLAAMMESLLFLARTEHPDAELERRPLDARKELEAVREYHEALAEENGVFVTCEGEARLEADPALLRRALSNLLQNALRYTPPGGRITLSVRNTEDRAVEFRVADTGCGIAPEQLPHLFDRFYRADRSRSEQTPGAGLGLAIVRAIVTLHRGRVSVQSEPGRGATVMLHFPLARG